jgi:hypothetical protein
VELTLVKLLLGAHAEADPAVVVLSPVVIEEKSSLKTWVPFPPPLEVMLMASVAMAVPVVLVADRVALVVPAEAGVPEMRPVAVFTDKPTGKLDAANEVGEFEAVIW